jgi:hypothetical protein
MNGSKRLEPVATCLNGLGEDPVLVLCKDYEPCEDSPNGPQGKRVDG